MQLGNLGKNGRNKGRNSSQVAEMKRAREHLHRFLKPRLLENFFQKAYFFSFLSVCFVFFCVCVCVRLLALFCCGFFVFVLLKLVA